MFLVDISIVKVFFFRQLIPDTRGRRRRNLPTTSLKSWTVRGPKDWPGDSEGNHGPVLIWVPFKNGDFPIENGDFPMKNGDLNHSYVGLPGND